MFSRHSIGLKSTQEALAPSTHPGMTENLLTEMLIIKAFNEISQCYHFEFF